MGLRSALVGTLVGAAALSGAITTATAAAAGAARPAFDARSGDHASVPQRTKDAREAFAHDRSNGASLAVDPLGGSVRSIGRTDGLLTAPATGDAAQVALAYVRDNAAVLGLDAADLGSLVLAARYTSPDGVTHLTWQQTSRGLPSYDGLLTVNVASDGRIVNLTGSLVHGLTLSSASPALSASDALRAAQSDVGATVSGPAARSTPGVERRTSFADGDTARLVAFADPDGDRLAWRLTVKGKDPYVYDEVVDAANGDVLARHSITQFATNASVYDYHPGAALGGTAHTVDLSADPQWMNRSTLTSPNKLDGRNAHAYADVGSPDGFNAGEDIAPSAGTNWIYPQTPVACASGSPSVFTSICTWSGTTATRAGEPTNRAQTTTQLFYFVNNYHDWLAQPPIGFTNASHNFEIGGSGGDDQLHAEADDSSGFDNANMSTPPDGQSPQMQMYLFDNPVVNSGDDASVVYHEYTHGLSNRLVNNGLGGGLDARQPGAMGEAWSDFYAMDYLVAHGLVTDTAADGDVVVGAYATNDQNVGIRTNALDCPVGSASAHCPGNAAVGAGGYTFADLGQITQYAAGFPFFEVHADGEIWAETLWDLRTALGAVVTRGLVTEAMRLSPSNPTYLDERDAILQADEVAGGTHHNQIWTVFAHRGMGYSAKDTGPESTRVTAAFDLPPASIVTAATPTVTDPAPLGDGDAHAEAGETARLRIALRNATAAPLTGVTATLSTTTSGVTVGQPTVSYPSLDVHASDASDIPFAVTLPSSLPCTTIVALSLAVHSDQGDAVLPLTLDVGVRAGTTYPATAGLGAIPDNSTAGRTATINIPDAGTIDGLRAIVSTNHTWVGDLAGRLTAPDGTSIELFERPGGGEFGARIAGFNAVLFDDEAPSQIQALPAWDGGAALPAVTGPFAPNEPLSKFDGHAQLGNWTLRVFDAEVGDTGSLTAVSLQPEGVPACSTPVVPATVATAAATDLAQTTATINGTLDPTTADTDFAFEWGATAAYGQVAGAGTALAGSGSAPRSAGLTGLSPATTYHYRLVARRAGTVVALTPDTTFATAAVPPPPAPPLPPPPPPPPPPAVKPSVGGLPKKVKLTSKGTFTLTFKASPKAAKGTVANASVVQKHKPRIKLGTKSFVVPSSGKIKLTFKPKKKAIKSVKKRKSVKVRATIKLGGKTFMPTFTLTAPKKR